MVHFHELPLSGQMVILRELNNEIRKYENRGDPEGRQIASDLRYTLQLIQGR